MTTAALQDLFLADNECFGCGPANPDGLHLKTYEDGDDSSPSGPPRSGSRARRASSAAA
jgi:hypothetical protein